MNLLFVGCGKMGSALLRGVARMAEKIVVVDPVQCHDAKPLPHVIWVRTREEVEPQFKPDVVVFAIKPQVMASVLPSYRHYKQSVFLSIAAGKTLAFLAEHVGQGVPIIRAMPNLPASIGKGISGAIANEDVTQSQRAMGEQILRAAGDVVWVENEELLNVVTALSGSGPAYVFALVEVMAAVGTKLGLPVELAEKLARQTVIGSGALLDQSGETAVALRKSVTSPGGTTEAALRKLMDNKGLLLLLEPAIEAAVKKAKELST